MASSLIHTRIIPNYNEHQLVPKQKSTIVVHLPKQISRRCLLLTPALTTTLLISLPLPSFAREKRARTNIPLEEYLTTADGLKYLDLAEGKGPVAVKGSIVENKLRRQSRWSNGLRVLYCDLAEVHFDCVYRGITALSSRESKLLAGNRIIAQPYQFQVGAPPGRERKREYVDKANGLFSAQAAPKPPPALYSIVEGMKVGGKRTVIVPPELGYGKKGSNEIPPGATFNLNIELLQVRAPPEGRSLNYR